MHVRESGKSRVVFGCTPTSIVIGSVPDEPVTVRLGDHPGEKFVSLVANTDSRSAIADLESALLDDLRECSRHIFSSFRDEYAQMFKSACRGDDCVVLEVSGEPPDLADETCVDLELTPDSVIVTPGRVRVTWMVAVADGDDALGFQAPAVLRANEVVGMAKEIRGEIDSVVDRMSSDDAADRDVAERVVRAMYRVRSEAAKGATTSTKEIATQSGDAASSEN